MNTIDWFFVFCSQTPIISLVIFRSNFMSFQKGKKTLSNGSPFVLDFVDVLCTSKVMTIIGGSATLDHSVGGNLICL